MNKIFMIKMMSQHLATPNRTLLQCLSCCSFFGRLAVKLLKDLGRIRTLPGQAIPSFLSHLKLGRARHWDIFVCNISTPGPTKTKAAKAKSVEAFLPLPLTPPCLARATSSWQKVGWPFFLDRVSLKCKFYLDV